MRVTASLGAIMLRELDTLRSEIAAYPSDADLWRVVPGISNPGGTLALHLTGNLRHFIGAKLGGTGYVRDREAEFSRKDLTRADLIRIVDQTMEELERSFGGLQEAELGREYPDAVAKVRLKTGDFLTHLASHFSYHLGQLDYHRRIVTGGGPVGGALSPTKLSSAHPEATS